MESVGLGWGGVGRTRPVLVVVPFLGLDLGSGCGCVNALFGTIEFRANVVHLPPWPHGHDANGDAFPVAVRSLGRITLVAVNPDFPIWIVNCTGFVADLRGGGVIAVLDHPQDILREVLGRRRVGLHFREPSLGQTLLKVRHRRGLGLALPAPGSDQPDAEERQNPIREGVHSPTIKQPQADWRDDAPIVVDDGTIGQAFAVVIQGAEANARTGWRSPREIWVRRSFLSTKGYPAGSA